MTNGKTRYALIDQFRGWSVLFMIETHVLNTFLRQDLRGASWVKIIDFQNGLVAPAFLFLAGFSFAIVALRRWDEWLQSKRAFWKQLGRYLLILLIGYCLHMPHYSFRVLFRQLKWNENNLFWGVDILHTIAVSLILMLLLAALLRRKQLLFPLLAVLGALVSLLTMKVQGLPVESHVAAPFAGYLKRILYSQFPLFPWMGYVLFGAFFSYLWQLARQKEREEIFFSIILAISGAAGFLITISLFSPRTLMGAVDFSPRYARFFFLKLALMLMLLTAFRWLEKVRQDRPRLVTLVGQESLLAYSFHIAFIYGPFWRQGRYPLSYLIGKTRPPLEIAVMVLLLCAVTAALCLAWHTLKKKNPAVGRKVHLAFWALVLLFFILHR